jgi:hypothetical protein
VPNDLSPEQRRLAGKSQKGVADPQTQKRTLHADLSMTVDPLLVDASQVAQAAAPTLTTLANSLNSWLSKINWDGVIAALSRLGEVVLGLLPPNARALGSEYWPSLQKVARDEQLCLSWVPDTQIARSLLDAANGAERDSLLVSFSADIWSACADASQRVIEQPWQEPWDEEPLWGLGDSHHQIIEVAALLGDSIEAARAGHTEAAQALATCVTDTLFEQHVNRRGGKTHSFLKRRLTQAEEVGFICAVVGPTLAAAESSYRQSGTWGVEPSGGRLAFTPYSRHATVHAAGSDVFTAATALKAILLATSEALCRTYRPGGWRGYLPLG